ncbi:MAG: oxidoreductase [Cereibacter sphaeroides]|uniref:Oxidoreductase n=1 Tax=Cereibacter sphaeroides TaxID=1063 RepID=A0A2W5UA44_CERSP|nr:MAG: oxidoreductase [Cereibacter sphaeroides]
MRLFAVILSPFFALSLLTAMAVSAKAEVVLTVLVRGTPVIKTFDREDLEKMPQVSYRTSTIWTDGVLEFQGVPLRAVLEAVGVSEGMVVLSASNDYEAEIPVDTLTDDVPMIAMSIDGKLMSLRDKGPLWLVYPYDSATEYQSEVVYTRSVWQLERIEIVP